MAKNNQATISALPPNGVAACTACSPAMLRKYRLPLNSNSPAQSVHPDSVNHFDAGNSAAARPIR